MSILVNKLRTIYPQEKGSTFELIRPWLRPVVVPLVKIYMQVDDRGEPWSVCAAWELGTAKKSAQKNSSTNWPKYNSFIKKMDSVQKEKINSK